MKKEDLLQLLRTDSHPTLAGVIGTCLERIGESTRCDIIEGDYKFSPKHFHDIYAGRMKNPNGVALNTPGLPESVENFSELTGLLKGISAYLDQDTLTVWLSEDSSIAGCIIHLGEVITPDSRMPKTF